MTPPLIAFLALLLFYLGVLIIMTADRVLTGPETYGSRVIYVDSQGNGDHNTIQAALDAAYSAAPATNSRWLVLVCPGEYQESLTLYDYIDIAGYAPGYSAHLVSPANQAAISNGGECTISNLRITGVNDPLVQTGASFTGSMRFVDCIADYDNDEVALFQAVSGTVRLFHCDLITAGRAIYITTGAVYIYDSILTRDGSESEPAIEVAGAGTLEAHRSSILNSGSGGGAAIKVTSTPASVILHHCLLRKASGSYSIDTSITPAVYLGACTANAAINPAITGTHDLEVDSNY